MKKASHHPQVFAATTPRAQNSSSSNSGKSPGSQELKRQVPLTDGAKKASWRWLRAGRTDSLRECCGRQGKRKSPGEDSTGAVPQDKV